MCDLRQAAAFAHFCAQIGVKTGKNAENAAAWHLVKLAQKVHLSV
jgi:hypothetical protein